MKRRTLWITPLVAAVTLPAHAITSDVIEPDPVVAPAPIPEPIPIDPDAEDPENSVCQITVNNLPDNFLIEIRVRDEIIETWEQSSFDVVGYLPGTKLQIWVYELDTPNQDFIIYKHIVPESDCRIDIEHVRFEL